MDGNAGVLVRVSPALRRDSILLVQHRFSGIDVAVLEDGGGVSEDKVNGTIDVAVSVELSEGVDIESVLVTFEAAAVEGGEVGVVSYGHCLVLCWTCCVLECYVNGYKSLPGNSCKYSSATI